MKQIHEQEKEQFKKLFRQENIDRINERFKILESFLQTERHITLEELAEQLDKQGNSFELDFIDETLKLLCRFGFADKVHFDNEPVRYEHRHLGYHHDHMVCTKCGKIIEFADQRLEDLQAELAAGHGFYMLQHKMEIYGICSECYQDLEQVVPLVMARPGERFIIKDLIGGSNAMMRLLSMGIRMGDEIEVISSQGKGQLVVSVQCNRYILGRGFAGKIMVQPVKGKAVLKYDQLCGGKVEADVVRLSDMKEGQHGQIVRVGGSGVLRRRILEMGINKGSDIYIEKYAPLKDPLELIIKGYHISLRVEEAAHITVENVK